MQTPSFIRRYLFFLALAGALAVAVGIACGGESETVTEIQTVVVEKQVTTVEKVVETVVVEKQVEGKTVTVIETVVVDRPVTRTEKVIETVVVEKMVKGETVKVVETVVVEKQVTRTEKVVETVVVEKVVVATAEPAAPGVVPSTWGGTLRLAAHGPGNHNDPFVGGSIVITGVFSPMYNKLVRHSGITPALPIIPELAQRWELSDNGLDYTFYLREGVNSMTAATSTPKTQWLLSIGTSSRRRLW